MPFDERTLRLFCDKNIRLLHAIGAEVEVR